MDFKAEAPVCFLKSLQEGLIVVRAMENSLPTSPSIHNMIKSVFVFYSQGPGH